MHDSPGDQKLVQRALLHQGNGRNISYELQNLHTSRLFNNHLTFTIDLVLGSRWIHLCIKPEELYKHGHGVQGYTEDQAREPTLTRKNASSGAKHQQWRDMQWICCWSATSIQYCLPMTVHKFMVMNLNIKRQQQIWFLNPRPGCQPMWPTHVCMNP